MALRLVQVNWTKWIFLYCFVSCSYIGSGLLKWNFLFTAFIGPYFFSLALDMRKLETVINIQCICFLTFPSEKYLTTNLDITSHYLYVTCDLELCVYRCLWIPDVECNIYIYIY